MASPLHAIARHVRRRAHRAMNAARGGRGVRVQGDPQGRSWPIAVSPDGYEDLRYWLRYEAATFALIRRVWQPGWSVLDVGAHHGLFSLCCCRPGALPSRVITVEPSPAALPLLRANRAVHSKLDWTIVAAAAGASEGHLRLHPGSIHMLVVDPALHPTQSSPASAVDVPLTTLDAIAEKFNFTPDLIKLDIEGYEAEALRGAHLTLQRRPLLVLEWHPAMLRHRGLDPLRALDPLIAAGYSFEPYEHPELGVLPAPALSHLPDRDIYRLLCR